MCIGQVKMPQISWDMENTQVAYKRGVLSISALRQGVKQAIADLWKLMEDFTCGRRLVMSIPDNFCCNKNSSVWGDT